MTWSRFVSRLRPSRGAAARALLLALGLGLLIRLSWQIGLEEILVHLRPLGWTVTLAVLPYLLVLGLDSLGWRYAFERPIPLGLAQLTGFHIIGKAVNLITPLAPIGGEPLKAYLLRARGLPLAEGLASVVVSRTLATIAQGLFVTGVAGLAFFALDLPAPLMKAVLGAGLAVGVLVGAFLLALTHGLFARLIGIVQRGWLALSSLQEGARDLDRRIACYYRHRFGRLSVALTFHLLSWLAEALEVYVLLMLLGLPQSLLLAVALAAFSSVVRAASFMIPASLGVQEGGNVLLFAGLGLTPGAAMAFSILRRLREAVWSVVGFLLLSWSDLEKQVPVGVVSPGAR